MQQLEGVLPVLKPSGMTSHDVVAKIRRIVSIKRVGHTGTLDPEVSGVLPICIGRATRMVEYIQDLPKTYEAKIRFGIATDTEDLSGQIVKKVDTVHLTEMQFEQVLPHFIGEIEQIPPMYSSIKQNGKRLYEIARQGKEVERKPRKVTIDRLELLSFYPHESRPEAHIRVTCSKGTYIRTLCKDIGEYFGIPSVMAHLIRTASGPFQLEQCKTFEEIEHAFQSGHIYDLIVSLDQAVNHLPAIFISKEEEEKAYHGAKLTWPQEADQTSLQSDMVRAYSQSGDFIGLYRPNEEWNILIPVKLFV